MKGFIPVSVTEDIDNNHQNEEDIISTNINTENNSSYDYNLKWISVNPSLVRRVIKAIILLAATSLGCFVLISSLSPFSILPSSFYSMNSDQFELERILRNASNSEKTVIITTLNDAWAEPNSIFHLFLESFRIGNDTKGLLKHLVVVCLDDKAYSLCSSSHPHCYKFRANNGTNFTDEAFFMTSTYVEMTLTKIKVLGSVLDLGYSFVFTDGDIMWLRNPFKQFFPEADFQTSCDHFNGNTFDINNFPNTGFHYARSNNRTAKFYKFWYSARLNYSGQHDQDVLNRIKHHPFIVNELRLKMRFLDTAYFGGFCEASRDLNKVCTMHANCCVGLDNKVNDLAILLEDWKRYTSSLPPLNPSRPWSVPLNCSTSFQRMNEHKSKHH